MHTHTYSAIAQGEKCYLCGRIFRKGERVRDRRSTLDPTGRLMCWNGEKCAERRQASADQELREMSAEDVNGILATMNADEACDFLERIGRLRAWLVYTSLKDEE